MGSERPKQYLALGSQTLLERSLACVLADERVAQVFVVVAPGDPYAAALRLPARCGLLADGGATRADTVRNGLRAILQTAGPQDWVLVHDAARPCLDAADLAALIDGAGADGQGGLLAAPVSDTIKRGQDGRVVRTEERSGLWRALTPQFFPVGLLARALERAVDAGQAQAQPTDEAAAVEAIGMRPRLIEGSAQNIKVTTPADLLLAEAILRLQGRW